MELEDPASPPLRPRTRRCSIARPASARPARRTARPMICRPSGRPSLLSPAGTLIAGRPARLAGTENTSLRYIASGSSALSPSAKAAVGAVGARITSHWRTPSRSRADQRADLHRLGVIGIVEAGREHIGADQDAALDLVAEAGGAGGGVHVLQARAVGQVAQAVAHAVIAGEVARGFGRGDDVVGRQRVFGVRQAMSTTSAPASFSQATRVPRLERFRRPSRPSGIRAGCRPSCP
jgi:hypothetical protein